MVAPNDPLISLGAAARLLGDTGRGDRPKHPSTLSRWVTKGVMRPDGTRVVLRAVRVGNRWATRRSWLEVFLAAIQPPPQLSAAPIRTPAQRRKDSDAAADELRLMGVG